MSEKVLIGQVRSIETGYARYQIGDRVLVTPIEDRSDPRPPFAATIALSEYIWTEDRQRVVVYCVRFDQIPDDVRLEFPDWQTAHIFVGEGEMSPLKETSERELEDYLRDVPGLPKAPVGDV